MLAGLFRPSKRIFSAAISNSSFIYKHFPDTLYVFFRKSFVTRCSCLHNAFSSSVMLGMSKLNWPMHPRDMSAMSSRSGCCRLRAAKRLC